MGLENRCQFLILTRCRENINLEITMNYYPFSDRSSFSISVIRGNLFNVVSFVYSDLTNSLVLNLNVNNELRKWNQ